jgi:hypothetical protein
MGAIILWEFTTGSEGIMMAFLEDIWTQNYQLLHRVQD